MIDNDQSTIIEAPEVYKSIPTHSPSKNQRQKNVDFDTFDGHVMVNYIEPNLQEIIFGHIRVGLITQKQFWDHLKNCHSWGGTPYLCIQIRMPSSIAPTQLSNPTWLFFLNSCAIRRCSSWEDGYSISNSRSFLIASTTIHTESNTDE